MNQAAGTRVRVWDIVVRFCHWSLAVLVIVNLWNEGSSAIHRQLGTAALLVVGLRLCWGLIVKSHARLVSFRPRIRLFIDYLAAMRRGTPQRYLGHNPAGAWMIAALWSLVILLGISGWMMRMDYFWGDEWLQEVHAVLAYTLSASVVVHVGAALWMSRMHEENLIAAMVHGDKRVLEDRAANEFHPP